jgi:hypothetical protein
MSNKFASAPVRIGARFRTKVASTNISSTVPRRSRIARRPGK